MRLLEKEAEEFNKIRDKNIEILRNITATWDEKAMVLILNYRQNRQSKVELNKVGNLTPDMLREIQTQIDGRPTMGNVDKNDVYIGDEER